MFFTLSSNEKEDLERKIYNKLSEVRKINDNLVDSIFELATNIDECIRKENGEYRAMLIFVEKPMYDNYRGIPQKKAV